MSEREVPRTSSRGSKLLVAAFVLGPSVVADLGCADDPCEDAIELCQRCELFTTDCRERFASASRETCASAELQYRRAGCELARETWDDGCNASQDAAATPEEPIAVSPL